MRPSSWVLIDRDVDQETPTEFAELDLKEFLASLDKLIPGIGSTTLVMTQSSSARFTRNGKSVSESNGHIFIKVDNPEDMDRLRKIILPKAIEAGLAWRKPRYSKAEPRETVGHSWATLIDPSVWNTGRLIFCGKPTVGEGLEVAPLSIIVRTGMKGPVDTAVVTMPDLERVRKLSKDVGAELSLSVSNGVISVGANDLKLGTELETQGFGTVSVRDLLKRGETGKVRCQTPFRDSTSWAAFLSTNDQGIPFIYDNGTNTTHWLNEFEQDEVKTIKASAVLDGVIEEVKEDSAAALEPIAVEAMAQIKKSSPAEYKRKRTKLKKANPDVSLADIDRLVKENKADDDVPNTHHGYAKDLIQKLTHGKWAPVSHNDALYVVDPTTALWLPQPISKLQRTVAETFDGQENCKRSNDYSGIAGHAISLTDGTDFFDGAPRGIACPNGFYSIESGKVDIQPLTPDHRQRHRIDVDPVDQPTPLFDTFLGDTFKSPNEGEEGQQCQLLQEIFGAVMLGLMPQFQKAILFYDPFGRSGKGTVERILRKLVSKKYVTAVSPFSWDKEYNIASLADSRFNVVGELPEDRPIPAAIFKSVLGGDSITGRHPTHRPITFKNDAAHLFMSNHFISTRDYSEAFFARWFLLEFPNSRLRSGKSIDPNLANRIVETEMPGIAFWALEGARRLLANGKFSPSIVHDRLMADWRRNRNSLEMFIHERCRLGGDLKIRRSTLYEAYKEWCGDSGRKPFGKSKVQDLLEHGISYGITHSRHNGIETFNGIDLI